jgi:hypothetical protein
MDSKKWSRNFLVFSYGKAGTQSVFKHLVDNKRICYYAHHENYFYNKYNFDLKDLLKLNTMLIMGMRDPIEQSISSLFQNLSQEKGHDKEIIFGTKEQIIKADISKIIGFYLEKQLTYQPSQSFNLKSKLVCQPSTWFNYAVHFLKENLDFDLLSFFYDKKEKYYFFKKNNIEIFIYKYKYFNEMNSFLNELIGTNGTILNKNSSKSKWYFNIMKKFSSKIRFTKGELKEIYDSDYSKLFLEEKDIKAKIKKYLYHKYL